MNDSTEKLEHIVDSVVRQQPLRRAPASLEARVLARIASERVRMPWWRRGFVHWPLAARISFLIASYGFVRLALAGVMSLTTFVVSIFDFLTRNIPPMWLYGAAVVGFVLYAALFGLGTLAYRTLYVQR
jgi:phospholipid N-methyltransferase